MRHDGAGHPVMRGVPGGGEDETMVMDFEELRRLAAAATPEPWIAKPFGLGYPGVRVIARDNPEKIAARKPSDSELSIEDRVCHGWGMTPADIAFICAVRSAVVPLLDRIAELEAALLASKAPTVTEAREKRVCRICGKPVRVSGVPVGWEFEFGRMVHPVRLTLDFGDEFAHTDCLPPEPKPQ